MRRAQRAAGFTLIELAMVMVVIGVIAAMAYPRMRVSPLRKVGTAARQLAAELDVARTRAMATKSQARVLFNTAGSNYVGFLDIDDDGVIDESAAETVGIAMGGQRPLPDGIRFGRGSAGAIPGDVGAGAVTFLNARVDFDARGVTTPFGTSGTIYLVHRDHANAVAAVAANASGAMRVWIYRNGGWE